MSCCAVGIFQSCFVIITYASVKLTVMSFVWYNHWFRVSWLTHTSPQMSGKNAVPCWVYALPRTIGLGFQSGSCQQAQQNRNSCPRLHVMMEIDTLCETFYLQKHKRVDIVESTGDVWYCVCFRCSLPSELLLT